MRLLPLLLLMGCTGPALIPVKCEERKDIPIVEREMSWHEVRKNCFDLTGRHIGGCSQYNSQIGYIYFHDELTRQHEIDHVQCQTAKHVGE